MNSGWIRRFLGILTVSHLTLSLGALSGLAQDDWLEPGAPQTVTNLSFDAKEFIGAFNASADRPRLVVVFSPT